MGQEEVLQAPLDPGLTCLAMLAYFHGVPADTAQLRHNAGLGNTPFARNDLLLAAKALGLKARPVQLQADRLAQAALPCLVPEKDGALFGAVLGGNQHPVLEWPFQRRTASS